jgi:hypothetical protein
MVNIPVLWVSRHPEVLARHYADEGLLEAVMARDVWRPPCALSFEHHEVRGDFPDVDGAVVVVPARHHAKPRDVAWLHAQLGRLAWSVLILAGDEEWAFPWRKIRQTPTRRVWVMQPRPEHAGCSFLIPGGWYPGTREHLAAHDRVRDLDWFFAGQVTHARREACVEPLREEVLGILIETDGYLRGIPPAKYFELMSRAKIIPCPSGPCTVDTARPLEALEAGCVPIVDERTPDGPQFDYWTLLFGAGHPLPTIADWSTLPQRIKELAADWPAAANRVGAFWQAYKRKMSHRLDADIRAVSGLGATLVSPDDRITVIVTTSPVARHPDTDHLEQVVASMRAQLPTAEILLVADGVRPEQEAWRDRYEEYLRRVVRLCNFEWSNVLPILASEWLHQAGCVRLALEQVTTPLVLMVEHDTPILGDIDWDGLCRVCESGEANEIRLHFYPQVHPEHEAVMLDHETRLVDGVPLRRSSAHWQRPHLARTDFYRDRVMPLFSSEARTMVEDWLYGIVHNDVEYGAGWDRWRIWQYCPGPDMRRSDHLDSRAGHPKYEMSYG